LLTHWGNQKSPGTIIIKMMLFLYIGFVVVFYPISRMYVNEYATRPIKLEFAFFMVIVAIVSNMGIVLMALDKALRFKKALYLSIFFATFMNVFILLLTNGNPLSCVANEHWNTVRYLGCYTFLIVGVLLCILVGKSGNETR
jgi:hypothetical protein